MRVEMGEPQGWRGMTRGLGARRILLVLGSLGAAGCFPGTTLVPGDPYRFDPVARLPEVAAYAGVSAKFLTLVARYVREDGTINLFARYITTNFTPAVYTFVQPQPPSDEPHFPVGAPPTVEGPKVLAVFVGIRSSRAEGGDFGAFYGGMFRETGSINSIHDDPENRNLREPFDTATPPPRCPFANLWATARQRGAPAGAIAVIAYDPTGYRFRIDGTPFKLDFDTSCNVKN